MRERLGTDAATPVLGLFSNEDELRDYLAERLELVEPGLTLVSTEYRLDNPGGSGGRIDILARDAFDHVICIEIKRSDSSARATLNELSKYVALLVDRDRIPRETIRCVVVSTHWHELLLPLSYFAHSSSVGVMALHAVVEDGGLVLRPEPLMAMKFLPQLSLDMDLFRFASVEPRTRYVELIRARAGVLPFVQLALLLFEPLDERSFYPMMACVWRIPDGRRDEIEAATGTPIGVEVPYAAPGC